jgi:hypothetical protein
MQESRLARAAAARAGHARSLSGFLRAAQPLSALGHRGTMRTMNPQSSSKDTHADRN